MKSRDKHLMDAIYRFNCNGSAFIRKIRIIQLVHNALFRRILSCSLWHLIATLSDLHYIKIYCAKHSVNVPN
jgi:hypothetical protein